ncbi:TonB-dependent receptor [Chitinophaga barathri]|uniref:TonB-dependent receptor n=1 Tax=Chitinophaga barathri TaxID=1647451 RepID=A0A3N4MCL7_9BACT|nr:TonB-dependent receptor [Chitinophaga barathri]
MIVCAFFTANAQTNTSGIRLTVTDRETGKPLPYVSISVKEWDIQRVTNEAGLAFIAYNPEKPDSIHISLYYIGKRPYRLTILPQPGKITEQLVQMQPLSLTIDQVEVNATRGRNTLSNSSVVIERSAIESIQAYSLADVLQLLPGQTIRNPDLQNQQALNLRSVADGNSAQRNNAFGIGFYVDDVPISMNGNMQTQNIGNNSGLIRSFTPPSTGQAETYSVNSSAGNGFDLRQMAVGNIEKIEVISGVAPARYGDITDGAVLIERVAGVSPLNVSTRFQSGNTNVSASKGFKLGGRGGMVNTSIDYINSVTDPRDRLKSYNRLNAGVLWTRFLDKNEIWKNTVAVDVFTTLDGGKADPKSVNQQYVRIRNQGFRSSMRGNIAIDKKFARNISYTLGFAYSVQEDYSESNYNSGVKPVTDNLQTGEKQGQFTPANYKVVESISGKPMSVFARLESNFQLYTANVEHQVSYGANFSYDDNFGDGRQYNPLRPRTVPSTYAGERPESFRDEKSLAQLGLYAQDNFNIRIGGGTLRNSIGVRADRQGKYWNFSPRLSTNYDLNRVWRVNAAFGLATKAPSMAYLYPGRSYWDVVLINHYVNDPARNLNLTYTLVENPVNTHLKSSRSLTAEGGISFRENFLNGSLTVFYKQTNDGFTSNNELAPLVLPNYVLISSPAGQQPVYEAQGTNKYPLTHYVLANDMHNTSKGFEVFLSTKKINAIQTSFDFATSFIHSRSYNGGTTVAPPDNIDFTQEAIIGRYRTGWQEAKEMISTLSTTHHIAPLGLLLNLRIQAFWLMESETERLAGYAIGYFDQQYNYHEIPEKDIFDPRYAHLDRTATGGSKTKVPMVYTNYHMRLAKEIKKKYRFSFYANNFLNHRPSYPNPATSGQSVIELNQAPAFGGEIVLKF